MNKKNRKAIKPIAYFLSAILWLVVWHIASLQINNALFLPSPALVLKTLFNTVLPSKDFWTTIANSFGGIILGFCGGLVLGIILAILSHFFAIIKIILVPPLKVIKSIPVASFVILVLLWVDATRLSSVIAFLIVLPGIYQNTLTALSLVDPKLIQMAKVHHVNPLKSFVHIYLPSIMPHILSSASVSMGFAWKAGVAAEVIGLCRNSIGNELYKAKLYLNIPELFAWTIVIVILSVICEKIISLLAGLVSKKE